MTLSQWIYRSVKRSPRAYISLFTTIMVAVAMIFAYGTIFFHPASIFNDGTVPDRALYQLFQAIFWIVVAAVAFALFAALGALAKEREGQFGLLLLLGVTRRQLQWFIAGETALVGFLSIGCGLLLGTGLSAGLLYLLWKVSGLSLPMYFSLPALGYAAGTFAFILLLLALYAPRWIYRQRILALLQAERRASPRPATSRLFSLFAFLSLAGMIGSCLWGNPEHVRYYLYSCLGLLLLGCYFFYSQGSVALAAYARDKRAVAWRAGRILWLSGLDHRLRDNARLLYFLTLTLLLSCGALGGLVALEEAERLMKDPMETKETRYQVFYRAPASPAPSRRPLLEEKLRTQFGISSPQRVDSLEVTQQLTGAGTGAGSERFGVFAIIADSEYRKIQAIQGGPKLALAPDEIVLLQTKPRVGSGILSLENKAQAATQDLAGLLATAGLKPGKQTSYVVPSTELLGSSRVWVLGDALLAKLRASAGILAPAGLKLRESSGYLFAPPSGLSEGPQLKRAVALMWELTPSDEQRDESLYFGMVGDAIQVWTKALLMLSVLVLAAVFLVLGNNFLFSRMYTDLRRQRQQFRNLRRLGVTWLELRRAATVQMAISFFLPLGVVVLLTECFFYYATRAAAESLRIMDRVVDTSSMFFLAGGTTLALLLLEVGLFLLVRWQLLRSLRKVA